MAQRMSFDKFKEIYSQVPRICVDLLVRTNEGVLLTKRSIEPWNDYWHFPGGTVLFGESLDDCAHRIAKEELGVKIKPKNFVGIIEYPLEELEEERKQSIALVLEVVPESTEFSLNNEAEEARFFNEDLSEKIIPAVKEFLESTHS